MKVWIVSLFDNLPHEGFRRQRYWMMAEAFAAEGHEVLYWTGDFNHGTKARRKCGEYPSKGIEVKILPVDAYGRNVCIRRLISHIRFAGRLAKAMKGAFSPDLVVAATPPLSVALAAMKAARRHGAKFVVDIQDLWPETFVRILPRVLRPFSKVIFLPMFRAAWRLYREADGVSGVSRRYRAASGREDFFLSYHGIVPDGTSALRRSAGSGGRRLVYIGNLGHGYDLETVIQAVALDGSLTLDVAGRGPKEKALADLVSRLGLAGRVKMHGYLPEGALRELIESCDVGVIPMRDDSYVGIPYKFCDYLRAGLKIISSLNGECGLVLQTERIGAVYEYASAESLLKSLDELGGEPVRFPPELDACRIYPRYVEWALSL